MEDGAIDQVLSWLRALSHGKRAHNLLVCIFFLDYDLRQDFKKIRKTDRHPPRGSQCTPAYINIVSAKDNMCSILALVISWVLLYLPKRYRSWSKDERTKNQEGCTNPKGIVVQAKNQEPRTEHHCTYHTSVFHGLVQISWLGTT